MLGRGALGRSSPCPDSSLPPSFLPRPPPDAHSRKGAEDEARPVCAALAVPSRALSSEPRPLRVGSLKLAHRAPLGKPKRLRSEWRVGVDAGAAEIGLGTAVVPERPGKADARSASDQEVWWHGLTVGDSHSPSPTCPARPELGASDWGPPDNGPRFLSRDTVPTAPPKPCRDRREGGRVHRPGAAPLRDRAKGRGVPRDGDRVASSPKQKPRTSRGHGSAGRERRKPPRGRPKPDSGVLSRAAREAAVWAPAAALKLGAQHASQTDNASPPTSSVGVHPACGQCGRRSLGRCECRTWTRKERRDPRPSRRRVPNCTRSSSSRHTCIPDRRDSHSHTFVGGGGISNKNCPEFVSKREHGDIPTPAETTARLGWQERDAPLENPLHWLSAAFTSTCVLQTRSLPRNSEERTAYSARQTSRNTWAVTTIHNKSTQSVTPHRYSPARKPQTPQAPHHHHRAPRGNTPPRRSASKPALRSAATLPGGWPIAARRLGFCATDGKRIKGNDIKVAAARRLGLKQERPSQEALELLPAHANKGQRRTQRTHLGPAGRDGGGAQPSRLCF
ncbi:hypothetical protein AAFF_G00340810 [Aldrovandia affinis]|uniref:Uncharacterized protein n=1 Tax=Aldrovandia affinis TaxID=143900 RepID=A0AAD7WPK9_9TELE|nr:hypothetical protein AAFF_G00340810 [Aldrovandia affinis]